MKTYVFEEKVKEQNIEDVRKVKLLLSAIIVDTYHCIVFQFIEFTTYD